MEIRRSSFSGIPPFDKNQNFFAIETFNIQHVKGDQKIHLILID